MKGFFDKVYQIVQQIPEGRVTTYGIIAKALGYPRAAKQVGFALHANPKPKIIPCHRVVNRFGELSKAFVFGGESLQRDWLMQEGITFSDDGRVDLSKYLWIP